MNRHNTKTYAVWRRNSPRPHLDGYIGVTAYRPDNCEIGTYDILLESQDWNLAHDRVLTERPRSGYTGVYSDNELR
ncbi:hypothetical protein ACIBCN_18700 [Nocardia sp. NPDC051052]|uniref:hypothetical protein n=1 Tax=Nocardia sp. NPDC051052 TaxID=3364322 RepID=UPI0037ABEC32